MKMILTIVHPVVIVAAATVFFAAGGGALCRAEGAAQNSATPLLSGGNPDPTVCRVGDEYYIVTSSFSLSPGLPVYRSKDMVNWEVISHAWRESWPCKTPDDGIWAPTLRHHNGVFYLTVTWHDGFKKAENYLLTAKDPAGPWSKPLKIDADAGIDGSLFFDGDDAWYLSNQQPSKQKWRGHCQIWMQRIDLETGRLFGDRHVLTDGFGEGAAFAEGPHLYKIGGKYLLLHAQGGTAWGHMEIALVSDCVTGPYTHVAVNPVLTAKDWGRSSPLQAFGHADLVQMPDGEWRAVFLGMRMADEGKKCPLGRETFSCRVDLDDNGLPTRFRRSELVAGDWNDPAATRYSLLDRPDDPARYAKVRDLAGRVDYPDKPFRFCAALAATPPRRATVVTQLSSGWEFSRDGETWKNVCIPHDWAISGPFDKTNDIQIVAIAEDGEKKASEKTGRTGALPWFGDGTYRRKIEISQGTQRAAVVFSGAMSEPEVFWDGAKVGEWKHGYTSFKVDLPDVSPGTHALEVRLHNRLESSRWYPGAGLFRPVYLVLDSNDPEEAVFARPDRRKRLPKIESTPDGFFIDGEKVKFRGVCLHHDLGSIGAEWNAAAFRRQLRLLKEIGVNAIRTAHNQPNPEMLDICDEEGVWVMAESFDAWKRRKVENGYNLWYREWWKKDLAQLVKVCRDHPCVVMYSIGNEISESVCPEGPAMVKEMQDFIHSLDPSRPCTLGNNRPLRAAERGTIAAQDIAGANYHIFEYEATRPFARNGTILGTETSSAISTRGFYRFPDDVRRYRDSPYGDGQVSSYDTDEIDWSNLADDDLAAQEDYAWTLGQFVWTGFDYLGEPSPYNLYWPSRSSYFGIYDLAGIPKDRAWLYRSVWRKDVRTLHILPHWTWPGREGKVTPVYVYTDAPEAELFVNGVSQGRIRKNPASRLDRFRLRWRKVVYAPGELKAVAFYPDGTTKTETVKTAGAPAALRLTADRETIALAESDGTRDLAYVTVEVVDKGGTVCPDAALPLSFAVEGDALGFKGVCNGDPTSLEVFTEPRMTTFHGALVVTLAARAKGEAKLVVSAPNIPSASIRLRVADEQKSAGMRETLSLDGEWSFEVTGGRRAGEKTTITVPSCWETQGFGTWQYGYNIEFGDKWHGHEKPADEHGLYLRKFTVPSEWRGNCVKLRFEGVMTEANVKVNGKVFPPHHSAWFPFEFDISDLVNYGGENTLEIDCGKESSDATVNRSERRCDFWNYGGIFRSVSLRTVPKLHIECVRIDARADGTLHAVVRASDGREETIDEKWTNIETWDVDHPKLYERVFELKDENGNVVDSVTKRFGFRTVEVRPRDGVYVNGKKIVVKGVNRQTFNVRTGRTLTREMNYEDARLIKSLNMNAVRIAHLTADEAFLDACDELGIYVEDEFCSWQKPIRTELGREYMKVFLERDHNHPSVIFWSNGNEGGWNTELDAMFKEIDLQKRAVLHPWAFHDGIDTKHYPDYDRLVKKLKTGELFMPTEFQHGLYDGGLGAGLEDFWTTMMRFPNCIGGFLWALKDEAQWRDDLGRYDACGNLAPDGLIGPNGEEGGSCATVRAIFGGEGDGEMQDEPPRRGGGEFTIPEPRLIAWRLVGETKGSRYEPVEASFEWTVTTNADRSVKYDWTISCTNAVDVLGVDFPCQNILGKKWHGRGPDRIWRNRMRGPKWGVWKDEYNDAVPGVSWDRPFKGWFEAKWMDVEVGSPSASHICFIPRDGLYMGVGSPKDGPDNFLYSMPYELGVGVYHVVPAIGNKLFKPERGGPQGRPVRLVEGRVSGSVELRL